MKKKYHYIALLGIMATMLTACEYKDLDEPYDGNVKRHVIVDFQWPNVDSIPHSMRVVFYPQEKTPYSSGYTFYDISNRRDTIEVPVSTYNISAWNNDTEHVLLEGYGQHSTTYATTGNYSPHGNVTMAKVLDSIYAGKRILDYPDYMVHANSHDFRIDPNYDYQLLKMTPDSMVVTMEVRIKKVKGLEHCEKVRGVVENIPAKRYVGYPNRTADPVAIMFDAKPQMADSSIVAKFWVFGIEPTDMQQLTHRVTLFFWITGAHLFVTMDATKSFRRWNIDDTYVVIEPDEIDLDLTDYIKQDGTGMVVDAEDWEDTEVINISF